MGYRKNLQCNAMLLNIGELQHSVGGRSVIMNTTLSLSLALALSLSLSLSLNI